MFVLHIDDELPAAARAASHKTRRVFICARFDYNATCAELVGPVDLSVRIISTLLKP